MKIIILIGWGIGLLLTACKPAVSTPPVGTPTNTGGNTAVPATQPSATSTSEADLARYAEYEMVTLLPRDAIPAIDDPEFLTAVDADQFYDPDELVIGIDIDGEARAYSVPLLSNHEIVNDTVNGHKIAITW